MNEKKFDFKEILKKLPYGMIITWLVALAIAIGAFIFLRNFIASIEMINLPGLAVVDSPDATPVAGEAPQPEVAVDAPVSNLPAPWDGASRVNILFMGLDE